MIVYGRPYLWITPACAGKRPGRLGGACRCRDHPRMRGEKFRIIQTARNDLGSPPHARGKVGNSGVDPKQKGITPACAGKRGGDAGS